MKNVNFEASNGNVIASLRIIFLNPYNKLKETDFSNNFLKKIIIAMDISRIDVLSMSIEKYQ